MIYHIEEANMVPSGPWSRIITRHISPTVTELPAGSVNTADLPRLINTLGYSYRSSAAVYKKKYTEGSLFQHRTTVSRAL